MTTKLRVLRGLTEARSYNTDAALEKGLAVQEKAADPTIIEAGKWRVAIAGDKVIGRLLEKDFNGVTGDYRIEVLRTAVVTP